MKREHTYTATIYCGFSKGYRDISSLEADVAEATALTLVREYCDSVKLGVTFRRTRFVYVGGHEEGCEVGLINYPRFPSYPQEIKSRAVALARILMRGLSQERVSVVCTDETIMLEQPEDSETGKK